MRLPIQVQSIIFKKVNNSFEFLLLKRIPKKGEFWQPVTGGLEDGESLEETSIREIKEETGIENIKQLIKDVHFYQFKEFNSLSKENKETGMTEYVFGVEVDVNTKVTIDKNIYPEHSEFKWCSFEEALELLKWDSNKKH